jgi:hypothetical protein
MELRHVVDLVATVLERSPRCFSDGTLAPPECIDEPEGRVQLRISDRLAWYLADLLRKAMNDNTT